MPNLYFIQKHNIAIGLFALLSAADLTLTKISLDYLGAIEANPIMNALFSWNLFSAIAFKLFIVLLVASISRRLWSLPNVRLVLAVADLLMVAVVSYQFINIVKFFIR